MDSQSSQLSQARNAEEYREILYSNLEEYQRLATMIADMLFLAKADNGLIIPSREPVDIRQEVEGLFAFYDALAEDQGIGLATRGEGTVLGDRLMLRRALSNLLSNAIRHTPRGGSISIAIGPAVPLTFGIARPDSICRAKPMTADWKSTAVCR